MKQCFKNILPAIVVFFLLNLACNFPTSNAATLEPETFPTPPAQLQGEGESGFSQDPATGRVTIVITEHDLTSFITSDLAAQEHPPIQNPQVLLRNGQIEVTGQTQAGPFQGDIRLVAVINIGADGSPVIEFISADLGPVPAPTQIKDQLSNLANDALQRLIALQIMGYRAEQIVIDTGRITITGVPQ